MKIVILASRFPYPLERGDKLRLFQQIKALSSTHEIHLFAVHDHGIKETDWALVKSHCASIYTYKMTWLDKAIGLFRSILGRWPLQCGLVYSNTFAKELHQFLEKQTDAVVYCQLIRMAPYCLNLKQKKVLDFMDAFGLGMERRVKISGPLWSMLYRIEAARVRSFEKKMPTIFDQMLVITQKDLLELNLPANTKIRVVPNTIDFGQFKRSNSTPHFDAGFIGNLGYLPNIEAVNTLIERILPRYQKKYREELSVLIAGARPAASIEKLIRKNIHLLADVKDISSAYADIKILVAPLQSGTGQQNKILEAMAMGIPVVTTPEVNMGIGATDGFDIVVANNEEEFADAIYRLLNDEACYQKIADNAFHFVKNNFSKNSITSVFS